MPDTVVVRIVVVITIVIIVIIITIPIVMTLRYPEREHPDFAETQTFPETEDRRVRGSPNTRTPRG